MGACGAFFSSSGACCCTSGAWFSYGGERLGQGRENAKAFLKQNTEIARAIEGKLRKELGLPEANGAAAE